jgi:hypothetical protein
MTRLRYRPQWSAWHNGVAPALRRERQAVARNRRAAIEADPTHPLHLARRVETYHAARAIEHHDSASRAIADDLRTIIDRFAAPHVARTHRRTPTLNQRDRT